MANSFFNPGAWSVKVRKNPSLDSSTPKLLNHVTKMRAASPLANTSALDFAEDLIRELVSDRDHKDYPSFGLMMALSEFYEQFYVDEYLCKLPEAVLSTQSGSYDELRLREQLRQQMRFLSDYEVNMEALRAHLLLTGKYFIVSIPKKAMTTQTGEGFLTTSYTAMAEDIPVMLDTIIGEVLDRKILSLGIMERIRNRLEANVMRVSKIDPLNPPSNIHKFTLPSGASGMSNDELVDSYLVGTPFRKFFKTEIPLSIDEKSRLEHTYILAGSGHGKTQLIQKFIVHDLARAIEQKQSLVVIDSQGDLISKIAKLDVFDPTSGHLADKLVIIDPNDINFPAAINMFAMDESRMKAYGPAEREKVQNSAIELYEHFFGELLGAELTARQGMVFKYLARLMLQIPNATILTLRDIMDDPKPFIPYMEKLTGAARVFFAREFFDRGFNATKKQISKRLWGVLSTPAFERLFSSPTSKIDLFELMNDGHIILINTAKDLLKESGASLYGRFFMSMIGQAIMERAVIPEDERTPTFLYIDECQDYFDETVEMLLAQGRKYKLGLTMAHQFLDQLTVSQRSSVLANTSIKAVGGINAKDTKILAQEMGCKPEFLQAMTKGERTTEFGLWIRHDLPLATKVSVPLGFMESLNKMPTDMLSMVAQINRDTYCWKFVSQDTSLDLRFPGQSEPSRDKQGIEPEPLASEPVSPPPAPITEYADEPEPIKSVGATGRGGKEHVKIQSMIKSMANHYGWKADLEYSVEGGAVDVWLEQEGRSIACEITVTTAVDYELHNIEKCLKAGADEVWVISEDSKKLDEVKTKLGHKPKVWFFTPDDLPSEIEARSHTELESSTKIRGYDVDVKQAFITEDERETRQARLAQLLKSPDFNAKS